MKAVAHSLKPSTHPRFPTAPTLPDISLPNPCSNPASDRMLNQNQPTPVNPQGPLGSLELERKRGTVRISPAPIWETVLSTENQRQAALLNLQGADVKINSIIVGLKKMLCRFTISETMYLELAVIVGRSYPTDRERVEAVQQKLSVWKELGILRLRTSHHDHTDVGPTSMAAWVPLHFEIYQ
ncbi:hypothetical protein AAMO2058_001074300 [Amorphochlora amoebiformis]